jgi:hypothetical protein
MGGGFALAGAIGVPAEKAAALDRLASLAMTDSNTEPAAAPTFRPHAIPARMLGPEVPVPVGPSVLGARNGWLVSDGRKLVAVYAGAAGNDSSMGRVVIVRQDLASGRQTIRIVGTGPTGALTISAAPLGSSVERTAQTGTIRLRTAGGRPLALDLGSDKVLQDTHGAPLP